MYMYIFYCTKNLTKNNLESVSFDKIISLCLNCTEAAKEDASLPSYLLPAFTVWNKMFLSVQSTTFKTI